MKTKSNMTVKDKEKKIKHHWIIESRLNTCEKFGTEKEAESLRAYIARQDCSATKKYIGKSNLIITKHYE
jgi:hypothetical protein